MDEKHTSPHGGPEPHAEPQLILLFSPGLDEMMGGRGVGELPSLGIPMLIQPFHQWTD